MDSRPSHEKFLKFLVYLQQRATPVNILLIFDEVGGNPSNTVRWTSHFKYIYLPSMIKEIDYALSFFSTWYINPGIICAMNLMTLLLN